MAIIRISKGTFPQEKLKELEIKLNDTKKVLTPAIGQLDGFLRFYAGIDPVSNSMINVSIWDSLPNAKQLDSFAPMLKLAGEFIEAGVTWDRPIVNFIGLWEY
jgi:hypothetical protein